MSTPLKYIKMTIRRKDGREVVAYFQNITQVEFFGDFIKELIEAVKTEAKGEKEE